MPTAARPAASREGYYVEGERCLTYLLKTNIPLAYAHALASLEIVGRWLTYAEVSFRDDVRRRWAGRVAMLIDTAENRLRELSTLEDVVFYTTSRRVPSRYKIAESLKHVVCFDDDGGGHRQGYP